MNRWAAVGVAVGAALLAAVVAVEADWSQAAVHDPARALLLGPRAAFVYARGPHPPVFGVGEMVLFLVCGLGFVGAGVAVCRARPADRAGWMIVVGGLLWLAAGLRRSGHPLLFTIGIVLTNAPVLLVIPVTLGFPSGRLRRRWEPWFVGVYWAVSTLGVAAGWMFLDPRAEPAPHPSTSVNLLLVHHDPTIALPIQAAVGILGLSLDLTLGVVVIMRWRSATAAYRFAYAPLVLSFLVSAAVSVVAFASTAQVPGLSGSWVLYLRYPVAMLLPVAVAIGMIRFQFARAAVGTAIVEVGAAPLSDEFLTELRRAVRDPTLELWTYEPESGRYRDPDGNPRRLDDIGDTMVATALERDGRPVGALVHDAALAANDAELLAAVRAAATFALDHERLQTELRTQLAEVRRSRERIAAAADTERQRIERNLHDGAQQRLISAAILLGRAHRARGGDTQRNLIADGVAELGTAIAELRELARGVYPPVLTERGLLAALSSLAETAPLPVHISGDLTARPPAPVEAAAYFLAAEALTNTIKHADASTAEIRLEQRSDTLRISVSDNGSGGARRQPGGGIDGLADRVAALGGQFAVDSQAGCGTRLTATFPLGGSRTDPPEPDDG
ncbi:sensor histidine kinase [Nocardia crassostreae]|uniref:sensor histidine kinase n=1 Tax=Nocardia crassostreae TaxID=53428 RepID=UPI000833C61E|nr:ATP-binding protein [Nocardia crassostreae]